MFNNNFFRAYGFWHWGEGFQTVLFTWYMAFHAELTATEIGFYQALVLSPFLVFTVFGGALTDRVGVGLSYVVSTSVFAAILISYGILDLEFGFVPELFFLYCIGAGIVSAISNPAIDTFIPGATDQPIQDNSLLAATAHNIAKLTGNISGLFLPLLSATGGFVVNGLLMAISVIFLRAHRRAGGGRASPQLGQNAFQHGIFRRVVLHYRICPENFDILLSSALLGLIIVPAGYILVPLILRERFPEYGDMIALIGISSWIGAILATAATKRVSARILRPGAVSLAIWGIYGVGLLVLIGVASFPALCLITFVFGGVKVGKALVYGKYLHNSPKSDLGLIVAVDQTAFWGLATLGTAGMGLLADVLGLNSTIMLTSGCVLFGVVVLIIRGHFSTMVQA
ncbi:Major Facilitator Superfamily protein [Ruegeria denitrificans]|uniref:Major Facilitator Superfamily protein n=1 Tax=Ruegeria denitrificans TaxID=1715692 RepID=A0A0P1IIX1_9RHOB|nr:MFS transporter [Ruegeria denitrificans]CUK15638.1 Major Facilitator Superfamily protein [Ruegeria denitrificans]